jgi:hypothetical protein
MLQDAEISDMKVRKRNDTAFARIAMAVEEVVSGELVKRSKSDVYPDGDAAKAWKALQDRYDPRNAVDQQILLTELFGSKLDDRTKGPELWIVDLQRMQTNLNDMGATISDNMLIAHILNELPSEYEHVADNLASQETKTIAGVMTMLKDKFERLKKSGNLKATDEAALVGYKKFAGNCRYCGKRGHKAADYFKNQAEIKNKSGGSDMKSGFHGMCHHCGKKGHKKIDCYQLQNKTKKEKEGEAVVLMAESAYINNVIRQEIVISEEGRSEEVIIIDGDVTIDAHIKFNQPTKLSWADMQVIFVEVKQ